MQTTLSQSVLFTGPGLHSGQAAHLTLKPASAGTGLCFVRTDMDDAIIPALWDLVELTPLCTRLVNVDGVSVGTVEHIMAALAGCGVRNAVLRIDGPEVPILDGSSAPFVAGILKAGIARQAGAFQAIEIVKPVRVNRGEAMAELLPAPGFSIDFSIDFEDAAIGQQQKTLNMANGAFVYELSNSRTFCRKSDIDVMHASGLALGGSMDNAVVVDGDDVLTPGGLRHSDEAVRHKMLDALGDLALAGAPILGRYHGVRAGHALTNQLLRALFADPTAYRLRDVTPGLAARLPGAGVSVHDLPA